MSNLGSKRQDVEEPRSVSSETVEHALGTFVSRSASFGGVYGAPKLATTKVEEEDYSWVPAVPPHAGLSQKSKSFCSPKSILKAFPKAAKEFNEHDEFSGSSSDGDDGGSDYESLEDSDYESDSQSYHSRDFSKGEEEWQTDEHLETEPRFDKGKRELEKCHRKYREANPGRRIVGRRIYDSEFGQTCHWCRQKTVENHVNCSHCNRIRFCGPCLSNRHGEYILEELQGKVTWVCPKCRGGCGRGCKNCCNCGPCRRAQRLPPTGQLVREARAKGFTNVHDYLVHIETHESAAQVALRKKGRGWTKSGDSGEVYTIPDNDLKFGSTAIDGPMFDRSCSTTEWKIDSTFRKSNDQKRMRGALTRGPFINNYSHCAKLARGLFPDDCAPCEKPSLERETWGTVPRRKRQAHVRYPDMANRNTGGIAEQGWTSSSHACDDQTSAGKKSSRQRAEIPSYLWRTQFQEQLEAAIRQPFSASELKDKLASVSFRTPVIRHRQTRFRSVPVQSGSTGLSYLDHHPDLAEVLENSEGSQDKLLKLRGFFFWLQHASMEGAFRPWVSNQAEDDDCCIVEGPDCEILGEFFPITDDEHQDASEHEDIKPDLKELQKLPFNSSKAVFMKVKVENRE